MGNEVNEKDFNAGCFAPVLFGVVIFLLVQYGCMCNRVSDLEHKVRMIDYRAH